MPKPNKQRTERDDGIPLPPVPPSVFYQGKRPKPVRSFEQLNDKQADRRHRQAERQSRRGPTDEPT